MILDTNAISAFFESDLKLRGILVSATKLSIPVIVLGEYRAGLLGSRKRRVIEPSLDELQAVSNVLQIDTDTVGPYSKLSDELKRAGRPIPTNDIWIAALAVQHGMPIVSRDQHFDAIPGIRRIAW
jgi:predicted nucleic acid-binding protein